MLVVTSLRVTVRFRLSTQINQRLYSNLKILYFGNDNFSLPSLKRL